ncbi:MAG: hypothetical protein IT462_00700 [Planctomycetes bacterium]|nr:hypothetical protein [Planctomycetota bacterium]
MNQTKLQFRTGPAAPKVLGVLAAIGLATFAAGLIQDAPRAWSSWLLAAFYFVTLALSACFFLAFNYLAKSGWFVALRRVPEAMTAWLPVAFVSMLVLALGTGQLYEWVQPHGEHAHVIAHKSPFLNQWFFAARIPIYFAAWIFLSRKLAANSRAQDADGDLRHTVSSWKTSAAFMVLFALTLSLASFDWLMSLDATWFSTIFGIYQFAGLFEAGIATILVVVILLRRRGYLAEVNDSHLHSLGQWLIATSVFWAYIWFSQFMLIWYSNIPEETSYYLIRSQGEWWTVSFIVNPAVNFVLPFILLLPRAAKRSPRMLLRVSLIVLVGHWIDLWAGIMPRLMPQGPTFGYVEAGVTLGFGAAFALVILKKLERAPLVPLKDPYLEESLHHNI